MRQRLLIIASFALAIAFSTMGGCTCEKTKEGELPEVEVKSGEMPEYDVKTADIDVDTETKTVEVPDIDVDTEKKTVEVPDIDVDMPDEQPDDAE